MKPNKEGFFSSHGQNIQRIFVNFSFSPRDMGYIGRKLGNFKSSMKIQFNSSEPGVLLQN